MDWLVAPAEISHDLVHGHAFYRRIVSSALVMLEPNCILWQLLGPSFAERKLEQFVSRTKQPVEKILQNNGVFSWNTLPWQRMSSWSHKELTTWWSRSEGDSCFLNMSWLTLDSLRMPRPHCQQNSNKWKMIGSVSQQFLRNLHSVLLVHPQENKHSTWEDAIPKGKASSTP